MDRLKPDSGRRIIAFAVDGGLIYLIAYIAHLPLSFIFGNYIANFVIATFVVLAMLLRDALPIRSLGGASPGKKFAGICAVNEQGKACDWQTSVQRNLSLTLAPLAIWIGSIFGFWGALKEVIQVLGFLAALLVMVLELQKILTEPNGIRIGDLIAGTRVQVGSAAEEG